MKVRFWREGQEEDHRDGGRVASVREPRIRTDLEFGSFEVRV